MSEPYWAALGGGSVDYKGAWSALTAYAAGDVVRSGGVDYLAVNPSTGVDPGVATGLVLPVGIGTSLPGSPTDGQEFILTDSLTAPTYSWRLRYVASITDAYKWVYLGGSPKKSFEVTELPLSGSGSYVVVGPAVGIPRVGIWDVLHTSIARSGAAGNHWFQFWSWTPTQAAIAGAREHLQDTQSGNSYWIISHRDRITIPSIPMDILVAFKTPPSLTSRDRLYEALPVRIA